MPKGGSIMSLRLALAPPVVGRSVFVAVIVGSILNLINQGDVMLIGGSVSYLKLALTYVVPFCVSTYGAYCATSVLLLVPTDNSIMPRPSSPRGIGAQNNEHGA
jgi:hypothetical protein